MRCTVYRPDVADDGEQMGFNTVTELALTVELAR